jgi:hypothetical protein
MHPYTFGALSSLVLSIISLAFIGTLLSSNASGVQSQLLSNVVALEQLISALEINEPEAIACQVLLPVKNFEYETCLTAGGSECQAKVAQEGRLSNLPAQIESARTNCTDRTDLLLSQIASSSTATANVTIVASGSMTVTVGAASFSWPYVVKRVVIGEGFRTFHITLPAWNAPSIGSNVTYLIPSPFCHYSDRKPLYDWQAFNVSSGGWVTAYEKSCNRIIVYLYGSGGTVWQTRNVTLYL